MQKNIIGHSNHSTIKQEVFEMVNIKKIDKKSVCACTSCQKSNEDSELYEIKIGKSERQTVTIRLCYECLTDFGDKAYNIYQQETDFLEY